MAEAQLDIGLPHVFDIIDHATDPYRGEPLEPFALEEILCREVGAGERPALVHLWRHEKALITGLRDRRLPRAEQAIRSLREQGVQVAVRNSGGAAVPLDNGVVNVSLILPNPDRRMDHRPDFERMYRLLKRFVETIYGLRIDKGEIAGSYCPGEFDLSIGGRKLCGISQRRQTKALIVQAFVVVDGTGEERAVRAKSFYDAAVGSTGEGLEYPIVVPDVMISLQEALEEEGWNASTEHFVTELIGFLRRSGGRTESGRTTGAPKPTEVASMIKQLKERYDK
jgi:octanoyl-[GcvH]:protein N-octanoyltransferase